MKLTVNVARNTCFSSNTQVAYVSRDARVQVIFLMFIFSLKFFHSNFQQINFNFKDQAQFPAISLKY